MCGKWQWAERGVMERRLLVCKVSSCHTYHRLRVGREGIRMEGEQCLGLRAGTGASETSAIVLALDDGMCVRCLS